MENKDIPFVFFGTPEFSVIVLEELKKKDLIPSLIVTAPDKKAGRGLKLTPPPVKVWADENGIPTLQPQKLKAEDVAGQLKERAPEGKWPVFALAAYGKILPEALVNLPEKGILNVHPSLLPKHRGPSPIQSQILSDDKDVGVSIMLIDEEMDHGPVLGQERISFGDDWPPKASTLENELSHIGGAMLADLLPKWISGEVKGIEQNHDAATFCSFIKKEDAKIDLSGNPYQNYLKIQAYDKWPRAYFFDTNNKRVIITEAVFKDGGLSILRVIPEGKKEIDYDVFKNT